MKKLVLLFCLLASIPSSAATHFIRTDGGTSLQCDGLTNAAYTGGTSVQWVPNTHYTVGMTVADQNNRLQTITTAGTSGTRFQPSWGTTVGATSTSPNGGTEVWTAGAALLSAQHCAVNNPIWLATHNNSSTTAFAWTTAANDTIQFEDVGPYYMGTAIGNSVGTSWQVCVGDEADCALPRLPNGTHFLGFGAGSCHASNTFATWNPSLGSPLVNATKLLAINHNFDVIDVSATSNVDVECFDISQPDVCTQVAATSANITHTSLVSGTATYTVTMTSSNALIAPGMFITVSGTTNGGGILNVTKQVATVVNSAPPNVVTTSFTFTGMSGSAASATDTGTLVFPGECVPGVNNYGTSGVILSNVSAVGPTNLTMNDIYVHGMSSRGLGGAHFNTLTTDTSNLSNIYLFANGDINYDGDGDNGNLGSESTGTINWTNVQSWWAGCIDNHSAGTVNYCIDQTYGGAGDNLVMIAAGVSTWVWTNIKTMFGTQDGFDSLHTGDDITNQPITKILNAYSEGNEGASIKGGGGHLTSVINSIGIASCDAITSGTVGSGNPAGWNSMIGLTCRAGDGGSFTIGPGDTLELDNDTFVGKQSTSLDIGDIDAPGGGMDSTTVAIMRNTTLMGFNNSFGQVGGLFLGNLVNPSINPFANAGGSMTHNAWFNMKVNSTVGTACPQNPAESSLTTVCTDPKFTAESSVYAVNAVPLSTSPLLGTGVTFTGIPTTDFAGTATTNPPVIGALNKSGGVVPTVVSIAIAPTSATVVTSGTTTLICTATMSDSTTQSCTSPVWTSVTPANATVNSSTGVVTGVAVGTSLVSAAASGFTSNNSTITVTSATGNHYTATCTPLMMHVGDEVPPGIYTVVNNSAPTVNLGAGATIFSTPPPLCTQSATNASPVGTYTTTMNAGTLANPGTDTITYTNSNIQVIAPTAIGSGAVLNNSLTYPTWFFSAGSYPIINAANNGICNAVGDGVTDNTLCLTELFAMLRGGNNAKVSCDGTDGVVTQTSGTLFTGITSGPMYVNGDLYHIGSVADSQHLTITKIDGTAAVCPAGSNLIGVLPPMHVSTIAGNPVVTWVSGTQFAGAGFVSSSVQKVMLQGGVFSTLTATPTATSMSLTTAPTFTSSDTPMYNGFLFNGTQNAGSVPFFIYFPAGVYLTHDQVTPFGAYLSIFGDGPYRSIIKLAPSSPIGNGAANSFFNQNAVNVNDTFNVNVFGVGFEVGPGNPNIDVIQWVPSNYACLCNVVGWADDSKVPAVANFSRNGMGPGLAKDFGAYGGIDGILAGNPVFAITGERLTVQGQTSVGILANQLANFWRHLFSFQPSGVPSLTNTAAATPSVVMDSEVYATSGALAFKNSTASGFPASSLFIKNTTLSGYTNSVQDCASGTCVFDAPGNITARNTGAIQTLFSTSPSLIDLPVKEFPKVNDPPVSQICQLGDSLATWPASFASCASTTIEAPPGQYGLIPVFTGTLSITVPDSINHINCNYATPPPGATYNIQFTVSGTSTTPLIIEGCQEGQHSIVHTGSRAVALLNDKTSIYAPSPGAGDLYCMNCIIGGSTGTVTANDTTVAIQSSQHVYLEQWNPEQVTADKMTCSGCTIWDFGSKSEHGGALLNLSGGAVAEVYGHMALGNPGPGNPNGTLFKITDSSFDFTGAAITQCGVVVNPCNPPFGNQFTNWATVTWLGVSRTLAVPNATVTGFSQAMGLFIDTGGFVPPAAFAPFVGGVFITGRIN